MSDWLGFPQLVEAYVFGSIIGTLIGILIGWWCRGLKEDGFWIFVCTIRGDSQSGHDQGPL